MRRFLASGLVLLAIMAVLVTGLASTSEGRQWLHRVDAELLGERAMDTLTRMRGNEDWSTAESLRARQDYTWLQTNGQPMQVAHALGDSGIPTANTLTAMRRAYAAGFRLLEVDLVLDGEVLSCQHDPGPRSAGAVDDGCRLDSLLAELPPDARLVLDIKTDFAQAGRRVVDLLRNRHAANQIIVQLYRPADLALFNRWQAELPLPGPIVTVYLAHRSVDHVARNAVRTGVQALTVPVGRLPALNERPPGVALLVHPIHDCPASRAALERSVDGIYTVSSLDCRTQPPPSS